MKKTVSILAAVIIMSNTVFAANFTDTRGHWAEQSINTLADRGVVEGFNDNEFNPDGNVTRAQYLKMIMGATGVEPATYREGECLEAHAGDWYAPYLQKALDLGLIPEAMIAGFKQNVEYHVDENGHATDSKVVYSGAFNGNLKISREEMAVLTQYFYQYTRTILTNDKTDLSSAPKFKDSEKISDWAKRSVEASATLGFIEGMDDGNFMPKEHATRAQAATIILRVLNKQGE